MRIIIMSLLLLISSTVFSQANNTIDTLRKKEIEDSVEKVLQKIRDSVGMPPVPVYDTSSTGETGNSGLDYFVRMQERQRKDKKKSAMLYIILGVLLFCILIFGLLRKPKKKVSG